ncbi:hypothetical protein [Rhizobium leguminosarum]|uniref:hypothetical protein n=1 Tax=Rhizobium leguminosarum TaxID=384 RepID=UPI002E11C2F2|nr:hypothetical protein U8Q02_39205 [Rhizobium leguminosarum]
MQNSNEEYIHLASPLEPWVRWSPRGIGSNWNIPDLVTGVADGELHPDMSGFVGSKEEGELAVAIFGGRAFLDFRPSEPNWIQVKVSAEEAVLERLYDLVRSNENRLTRAIVAQAVSAPTGSGTRDEAAED